jgi:hypothetical protein
MADQVTNEEIARAVEALAPVVEKAGLSKAQIISHLSPYDSGGDKSWAGEPHSAVKPSDVGTTVDQTDYIGVKKSLVAKVQAGGSLTKAESLLLADINPLAVIAAKVAKSESLTSAELWAVNGGVAKAMSEKKMKTEEYEGEDASEKRKEKAREKAEEMTEKSDVAKSLLAALATLQRASVPAQSNDSDLRKSVEAEAKTNAEFREVVAKSLAHIGQLVAAQAEKSSEVAPARGPKAAIQGRQAPQAQGLGAFGPEEINKGGISRAIRKALEQGDSNVEESDLMTWESELKMRPELKSYLQRTGR